MSSSVVARVLLEGLEQTSLGGSDLNHTPRNFVVKRPNVKDKDGNGSDMIMGFIPRTYQRAAGLQSEVTKWAVTRIAHRELEQRKLVTVAKNDMTRSIREICRGQKRLRRSMMFYSNRMKQCRLEKEQRELDAQEKVRVGVLRQRHDVGVVLPPLLLHTLHGSCSENGDGKGLEGDINYNLQIHNVKESNNSPYTDLLIPEAANRKTHGLRNSREGNETGVGMAHNAENANQYIDIQAPGLRENSGTSEWNTGLSPAPDTHVPTINIRNSSVISTNENSKTENSVEKEKSNFYEWLLEKQANRRKKKKKGYVSHIDIMKLQCSSNIHRLFDAVDTLAKVHGIKEHKVVNELTILDPRDNAIAMKRRQSLYSRKQVDMTKLPSVYLYTMMHGYDVIDDTTDAVDGGNLTLATVNATTTRQNPDMADLIKNTPISTDVSNHRGKRTKPQKKDPTLFPGTSSAFVVQKIPPLTVKVPQSGTEDSTQDFNIIEAVEKANKNKNHRTKLSSTARAGALNLPPIVAKPQQFQKTAHVLPKYSYIADSSSSIDEGHISWETALGHIKEIHFLK